MKEVIRAKLLLAYDKNVDSKSIDEMVNNIMQQADSFLYQQTESIIDEMNEAISTIPSLVSSLATQVATIPTVVIGMAAPAAAPMVLSVKSQATALKHQIVSVLSKASSLGIDIPGIDPIILAIKVLKTLL